LWPTAVLSRGQQKALLRGWLAKGVVPRVGRDQVQIRIGWRGGEVTEYVLPRPVGALAALATGPELEARGLPFHKAGKADEGLARELTAAGCRSPLHQDLSCPTFS
jgi:hypothetical protein